MRRTFSPVLVMLLVVTVGLSGCATKKWVDEQISEFGQVTSTRMSELDDNIEVNQKQISELEAGQAKLESDMAKISATAKDALNRANEAGVLAKGSFLLEVTMTDNDVNFGFDKYKLSDAAKAALDNFAASVKSVKGNAFVEIQGHTDNIGSESYNLKLGHQRAEQAMRYLNMEQGIPLFRMNVISYGEYKPIADNSTKEGRGQNRRVTLVAMQ